MATDNDTSDYLRELVATVAAAYFSNVHVPQGEIPGVVKMIAESLRAVGASPAEAAAPPKSEEKIVLGYRVTSSRKAISPSEAKERRAAVARILSRSKDG